MCETSKQTIPKEVWKERTCIFYNKGAVETEWNFVIECAASEDMDIQYEDSLKADNMHHLFEEDKINQIASLLIKIQSKESHMERVWREVDMKKKYREKLGL